MVGGEVVESLRCWLAPLEANRRAHSLAVGQKAASQSWRVEPELEEQLVAAATLHDVGYAHVDTGFHPLDGARFLRDQGFSDVVCCLVLNHSASSWEAEERGISLAMYDEFAVPAVDLGAAHQLVWWADMTTGPTGATVSVEQRLDEIQERYGPKDVVARFIGRARPLLTQVCQLPGGSIQVPV